MPTANATSTSATEIQTVKARLDAVVSRAIADHRIVSAVIVVLRDGKRLYRRARGIADPVTGRLIHEDAIFRVASLTKPLVTAAAMRLIERGQLRLDDAVTKWLPTFRPKLPDAKTPLITVHHLLTHTSGLGYRFLEPQDGPYHRLDVSDGLDQPGLSMAVNLRRLAAAPLLRAPGSGWGYSLSIDVLGAVVQKAQGEPLPQAVERHVTGPLEMRDTGFRVRDPSRLVVPYADGTPLPVPMTDGVEVPLWSGHVRFAPSRVLDPRSYPSGGAGMVGTADDFVSFLEAIRAGGAPILERATVATMMRDHVGPQAETQGRGWGFGYGWAVLDDPVLAKSPQSAGTIQWGGAYGHSWFVDPSRGLTVVALTNTAFEGMSGRFPKEVRNAVYEGLDAAPVAEHGHG